MSPSGGAARRLRPAELADLDEYLEIFELALREPIDFQMLHGRLWSFVASDQYGWRSDTAPLIDQGICAVDALGNNESSLALRAEMAGIVPALRRIRDAEAIASSAAPDPIVWSAALLATMVNEVATKFAQDQTATQESLAEIPLEALWDEVQVRLTLGAEDSGDGHSAACYLVVGVGDVEAVLWRGPRDEVAAHLDSGTALRDVTAAVDELAVGPRFLRDALLPGELIRLRFDDTARSRQLVITSHRLLQTDVPDRVIGLDLTAVEAIAVSDLPGQDRVVFVSGPGSQRRLEIQADQPAAVIEAIRSAVVSSGGSPRVADDVSGSVNDCGSNGARS